MFTFYLIITLTDFKLFVAFSFERNSVTWLGA